MVVSSLHIPEFLKRKKKRGRPRKILQDASIIETKWNEWDKTKQQKYGIRYDMYLDDDAPRIGSGFRTVYVKEGRKWAHMTSHTGDPNDREGIIRKRFRIKKWLMIKESHKRYLKRNKIVHDMQDHEKN